MNQIPNSTVPFRHGIKICKGLIYTNLKAVILGSAWSTDGDPSIIVSDSGSEEDFLNILIPVSVWKF